MRFKLSLLVYSCLQGGVSIWQLSRAALTVKEAGPVFGRFVPGGCVCVCVRVSPSNDLRTGIRASLSKKTGTTLISSVFAMFPTIFLHYLLWSRQSYRLTRSRLQKRNKKLMHLASLSCLFWPGKVPRSVWLAFLANSSSSGSLSILNAN